MNPIRSGRGLIAAAALVLFLPASLALADSSIRRIHSTNFGIDQGEIESIKAQMQAAVDGDFLNGALLLVGNGEGVGVLESVGLLSPENPKPVNKDSIFRIFSMTKPIVSVAIMTMVEDGLMALDDPVEKFIPEFADGQIIDRETGELRPVESAMTVENLLTHESGLIQAFFSPDSELGQMYGRELRGDFDNREFAARIGGLPLYFEPGTAWHYGHSTDVLGALLEVVDGNTLDVVLNERIFDPLGMDETTFVVPLRDANRVAEPIHGAMSDNTAPRRMLSGGGGLNSTTEDYVRFAEMLLNGGEYRGARIIEEATLARMLEPKIGGEVSREFFFYGDVGDWGLGFHLQPTSDYQDGPYNFGWRGIGGTIFIVDQENDFYMVYMEQKRGGPQSPFNANIAQRVVYEAMSN
ncbi:MAG: beta-lactamase family protein [Gammaproteobacteria bacterium]|nr:beta-lactamase family protein [Gammaproteobacteria bacterium]MYG97189.1 beta-lactamase family protein [Gammaproteobacteria bacterium]